MASLPESLKLEVATPRGLMLATQAESVQAPSVDGEFGVLPGHLPLLAALKAGLLKYRAAGKDHVAAVGPGFVEAGSDRVLVLTELFITPDKIDPGQVRTELATAEERLRAFADVYEGAEYQERQRDVDWAIARLDAVDLANR